MKQAILVVAAVLASAGCSPARAVSFSCDVGTGSARQCTVYSGYAQGYATAPWETACTATRGTAGTTCSATDAIGSCRHSFGAYTTTKYYYGGSVAEAQTDCLRSGGVFFLPGASDAVYSCDAAAAGLHTCQEYTGWTPSASPANFSAACTAAGGTWGRGCVRDGVTSWCRTMNGVLTVTAFYYGSASAEVSAACARAGGTFGTPSLADAGTPGDAATGDAEPVGPSYGRCGDVVFGDCLCAAGSRSAAASCALGSGAASSTCQSAVQQALRTCCPEDFDAAEQCSVDAVTASADGGAPRCAESDSACIARACATPLASLATCVNAPASGTCAVAWRTAFGTANPASDPNCR